MGATGDGGTHQRGIIEGMTRPLLVATMCTGGNNSMSDTHPANGHAPGADVVARVVGSPAATDDLFAHIDLDVTLKDDLYEAIGDAIKARMHLRERYPVRLSAPRADDAPPWTDAYLAEAATLIEGAFERIAGRVAHFVNDELLS